MKKTTAIVMALIMSLSGCSGLGKDKAYTAEFFAMDTFMQITICGLSAEDNAKTAEAEIRRLDKALSINNENSELAMINKNRAADLSADMLFLINEALTVYKDTDGAFDITIEPLVRAWGFYGGEYKVPSQEELSSALAKAGGEKLQLSDNRLELGEAEAIDLGGIAKGYASDRVAELLRASGVVSAIISLGGNVCAVGNKPDGAPWRIGIQDPQNENELIGTINATDMSVITSGAYQRYFEQDGIKYHHIIDPSTGYPANSGLLSVTVVCRSGITADALSTALFVMGFDKSCDYWQNRSDEFDVVFVTNSGEIFITDGLKDIFRSEHAFSIINKE